MNEQSTKQSTNQSDELKKSLVESVKEVKKLGNLKSFVLVVNHGKNTMLCVEGKGVSIVESLANALAQDNQFAVLFAKANMLVLSSKLKEFNR